MAKTSNYTLRFKLQALFCVALTLQLQFLTVGCGQAGLLGLPGAGVLSDSTDRGPPDGDSPEG